MKTYASIIALLAIGAPLVMADNPNKVLFGLEVEADGSNIHGKYITLFRDSLSPTFKGESALFIDTSKSAKLDPTFSLNRKGMLVRHDGAGQKHALAVKLDGVPSPLLMVSHDKSKAKDDAPVLKEGFQVDRQIKFDSTNKYLEIGDGGNGETFLHCSQEHHDSGKKHEYEEIKWGPDGKDKKCIPIKVKKVDKPSSAKFRF